MNISLVNLPAVGIKLENFFNEPIHVIPIYRRLMPASLVRIAAILRNSIPFANINIYDLKYINPEQEIFYKQFFWEGFKINCFRIGESFEYMEAIINESSWIGISNHFTQDSHIARDFIQYSKKINPKVKIVIGGADPKSRPQVYLDFGADLVFRGDIDPTEILQFKQSKIVEFSMHPIKFLTEPALDLLPNKESYIDSHDGPFPEKFPTPIGLTYLTRGCYNKCDFCETAGMPFQAFSLNQAIKLITHYKENGFRTINFVDDNLLLHKRSVLIDFFSKIFELNIAWEFPNGLQISRLFKNGNIDRELFYSLFRRKIGQDGKYIGFCRMYFPIESFDSDERKKIKKLKSLEQQKDVIKELAINNIPEIGFGVIINPDSDKATFEEILCEYQNIKTIIASSSAETKVRCGMFHLIPIGNSFSMKTKYSRNDFPELWNFYTPSYDGKYYTAKELFERRMELTSLLDPKNYTGLIRGYYGYSD